MTDDVERIVRELRERPPAWRASDDRPDLRGACNLPDGHRYDGSCALCRCGDRPEALEVIVAEVLRLARPSVPEAPMIPGPGDVVFNRVPDGYERSKWEGLRAAHVPLILERRPICPSCGVTHSVDAQPPGNPLWVTVTREGDWVLHGSDSVAATYPLRKAIAVAYDNARAAGWWVAEGYHSAWLDPHGVPHLAWWVDGPLRGEVPRPPDDWTVDLDDPADSNGVPWAAGDWPPVPVEPDPDLIEEQWMFMGAPCAEPWSHRVWVWWRDRRERRRGGNGRRAQ